MVHPNFHKTSRLYPNLNYRRLYVIPQQHVGIT
jgi:hypothetical protein